MQNTETLWASAELKKRLNAITKQAWELIKRRKGTWGAVLCVAVVFPIFFSIRVNLTPSLPYKVFIVAKLMKPHRDELVAFKVDTRFYPNNHDFVKIMKGVEGDTVTNNGRDFFVNGIAVGTAKERSSKGVELAANIPKVIGPGEFYAYAPHKDSLDSRYAEIGYIKSANIIGRAFALF